MSSVPITTPIPKWRTTIPYKTVIPNDPIQLRETTVGLDEFENWFKLQKPGTRAYWPGSENSAWAPGWYQIKWGGNTRAYSERGRMGVGEDETTRGVGTPAKTYGRYVKALETAPEEEATKVEVVPGQLPNVELNYTEPKIIYP